ncbi:MAG: AAA family ATPase [Anaerolineales bacterium]
MVAELSPSDFRSLALQIEAEIGRVIVGQREVVRHVLTALLADGHLLLEGLPGLGKTMLVRTLAAVLQLDFTRVQFTPDLMPSDILGTDVLEITEAGGRHFRFHEGPVFTNLLLADEINRATPKTQSALLEAMQERQVSIGGRSYPLPAPFLVLATQNPIELEGTYPLPEAQLDRFLFKVNVDYPSAEELVEIVNRTTGAAPLVVEPVAGQEQVLAMQALARGVPVATPVADYAARITVATHPRRPETPEPVRRYVRYGASPRGAQALLFGGKVHALLAGRYNVAFEDVQAVAAAALRHRLILTYQAEAEDITPDQIVRTVLETVEA